MQAMSTSYACSKGQVRRAGQRGGKSTFKKEFVAFGETDGAVFGFHVDGCFAGTGTQVSSFSCARREWQR